MSKLTIHNEISKFKNEIIPKKKSITFSWYGITASSSYEKVENAQGFSKEEMKKSKKILQNVSGVAYPGELFIIMGSSGSGKTTLLNCVTFRNTKTLNISGLVQINNKPTTQQELAGKSAYVQQDDIFIPYLTVKEHMIFQARLRMDSRRFSYKEKMARIDELLTELLLVQCQDVSIGLPGVIKGISGGERKRLAVASELLMNPSLLFCDETTTGLDSFMALNIMKTLKDLSRSGKTVICTIHQPSSELYQLFDKICLLSEGRTAFLGSPKEANEFFTRLKVPCPINFSPADHYIQILSIIPGKEELCKKNINCICDAFEQSNLGVHIRKKSCSLIQDVSELQWEKKVSTLSPYKVSWCEQFHALLWRCWLRVERDPKITRLNFISYLTATIFISLLYYHQVLTSEGVQNICGVFFLFLTNITFKSLGGALITFGSEIPLFLREHKNGLYRTDVYYISKSLVDLPWFTCFNCMFTGVCYIFVGLNHDLTRFLTLLIITSLVCYLVLGVGYIISVASPSPQYAQQLIGAVVTPFIILGGFFLDIRSVPLILKWLANLSWFKWAYVASLINQWSDISYINCTLDVQFSYCIQNGSAVLEKHGIGGNDIDVLSEFIQAILMLIFICVMCRIVAFLILLYKAYNYDG